MAEDTITKNNIKKGYFTLEAAIFLPVFILSVLTIGSLILFSGTKEKIGQIALDELGQTAARAYITPIAPEFTWKLEKRMQEEISSANAVWVNQFRYLYQKGMQNGQIYLSIKAEVSTHLPPPFQKTTEIRRDLKCRGLVGKQNRREVFSFDEMEQPGNSYLVWIFPAEGKRYHKESCTYVSASARQMVLNQKVTKQYDACKICKSQELPIGSLVYCFKKFGEVYHKGTCKTIDKYVKEVEKAEAQKRDIHHARNAEGRNMEFRKNDFKIKMKDGCIKDYEKIILSSGMCDLFMPMGFVSSQGMSIISYDCSGYTALSQCTTLQVKDALDILEKTFLILSKAGEYLITPSKITLSKDTIFYNEKTRRVKIAYIPMEKQFLSVRENMMDFIVQVEENVTSGDRKYLRKVREHLDHNNYYIKDIIDLIGELKRIYFLGTKSVKAEEA